MTPTKKRGRPKKLETAGALFVRVEQDVLDRLDKAVKLLEARAKAAGVPAKLFRTDAARIALERGLCVIEEEEKR
jgi:hypothetical protein